MEILHTKEIYYGLFNSLAFIFLLGAIISLLTTICSIFFKELKTFIISISLLITFTILFTSIFYFDLIKTVKQHEVILEEGYIIDATKYKLIEQRGEILVIREIK